MLVDGSKAPTTRHVQSGLDAPQKGAHRFPSWPSQLAGFCPIFRTRSCPYQHRLRATWSARLTRSQFDGQAHMVVKTYFRGGGVTGLHVGISNARRYFPRHISFIELHLDHLQIHCRLEPGFWRGEPEIHDSRLCAWLMFKNLHAHPSRSPVPLALIPFGVNSYRLQPISLGDQSRSQTKPRRAPRPAA